MKKEKKEEEYIDLDDNEKNKASVEEDIVVTEQKDPSDLILSLNLLLDDKNIKGKTILNNRQVTGITLMNWAGQVYDIPFLVQFVNDWCRYRISGDNGKGRQDLIAIAQAVQLQQMEQSNRITEILGRK